MRTEIAQIADRVLDAAQLGSGMTLVDVGSGDGLVAFRAIDRVGPSLRVFLTDVSASLLQHSESVATQRGIRDQRTFLQCSAEALRDIAEASVDVVTTRAVLAYLPDKIAVLREFRRILKPGGRVSIAEPIRRDDAFEASSLKKFVDALPTGSDDQFFRLLHRWRSTQFPDTEESISKNPMTNYSERDLVRYALDTGFTDIHMEFHIDVAPSQVTSWDVLLRTSPLPWAPPLGKLPLEQFTVEERRFFEQVFRPRVESCQLFGAERIAYLSARKPLM
ncbi:class I SAM-dependent methyltransferase [Paraburkholderia xenovorans]|uniref:class I SAM-dependent methyltransferase n=1 Tax=Paraburkholderia xenovorans TaxID=36873 RepID=UPI0038BB6DCA